MKISLGEIATLVNGRLCGDASLIISGADILRDAKVGEITLASSAAVADELANTSASAVVVPDELAVEISQIVVDDPQEAFAQVVAHFRPPFHRVNIGISPHAFVNPTARIADTVNIHPGARIEEDVQIGARTTIHAGAHIMPGCCIGEDSVVGPNVVFYERTLIGSRTIIHGGVVLGCHGFSYEQVDGKHIAGKQLGNTVIGDDVEIGANTTIDRGTYGATTIGEGTKIDNLVMIGHNCRIGRHNIICSQVGIAGSVTTGDYVVMGGQVGIRDHLNIGARTSMGAQSGIMSHLGDDETVFGSPARSIREQMSMIAVMQKLPALRKQVLALQRIIAQSDKNSEAA